MVFGHPRYRLPLTPILAVYAGAAVSGRAWRRLREGWRVALLPAVLAVGAGGDLDHAVRRARLASREAAARRGALVIRAVLFDVDGTLYHQAAAPALDGRRAGRGVVGPPRALERAAAVADACRHSGTFARSSGRWGGPTSRWPGCNTPGRQSGRVCR